MYSSEVKFDCERQQDRFVMVALIFGSKVELSFSSNRWSEWFMSAKLCPHRGHVTGCIMTGRGELCPLKALLSHPSDIAFPVGQIFSVHTLTIW